MASTELTTLVTSTPQTPQQTSQLANSFGGLSTTSPPTAAFQELSDNNSSEGSSTKDDAVNDPLVNALAVLAIPGLPPDQACRHTTPINNSFQPSLANLRTHAEHLVILAHQKNTICVYDRAWGIFMAHLQLYDKSLFPLSEFDFVEFVAFLSMADLAPATILSYISEVKYHLRIRFLNDFKDSFLLKLVAKGIASQ